jgi:hypothetical protein
VTGWHAASLRQHAPIEVSGANQFHDYLGRLRQKTEEEEKINKEKVSLEIKQLKRNSILSWLSVAISLIALIFGIASYFKPTNSSIEKQYIPVDSHGKIYETLNKN